MASPLPGNSLATGQGFLKRYYRDGGVIKQTFLDHPMWAMMTKKADSSMAQGSSFQFPTMTNDIQARNTVFASAQAMSRGLSAYNTSGLTGTVAGAPGVGAIGTQQWSVLRAYNYSLATISTELQLAAESKRGAFDDAKALVTDSALSVLGGDMEISLFGGGITVSGLTASLNGFISQIQAGSSVSLSTGALTLQNAQDVNRFSVGQELDLYFSNSGVLTKRTNAGSAGLFVGSIDRISGILYIVSSAGAAVTIASVFSNAAAGDLICVVNDQGAKINSFESWIPFGGPVGDSGSNLFCGINRLVGDTTRLAGNWLDATGGIGPNAGTALNIEDAIINATALVAQQSDKQVDTVAYGFNQHTKLLKSAMSRTVLPGGKFKTDAAEFSYPGVQVDTASGVALCVPNRMCSANRILALHMDSWEYIHLGDPIVTYSLDGTQFLREADMDAQGCRFLSFGNLICTRPPSNCTINIAA